MRFASFAMAVGLVASPVTTLAHHGSAAYDMTKLVTVQGTVTGYEFVQPHVLIYLDVKGDKGNIEKWLGESNTPNIVAISGWSRNSLKPGDPSRWWAIELRTVRETCGSRK